jgi:serine/threonine protein kinase
MATCALDGMRSISLLHRSPNSEVWRAIDEATQKEMIIKISEGKSASLEKERQILELLQGCPGVVGLCGLRKTKDHRLALIMEGGGKTLAKFLDENPLTLHEFVEIGIQLTRSLGHIHSHNILHGDLKPDNILYDQKSNTLHIVDFSVSILLNPESNHKHYTNELFGTPSYISPEQSGVTHRPVDIRSDLYSIGVCFYLMMARRLPFISATESIVDLVHSHLSLQPPPITNFNPEIPYVIEQIIHVLLEKDPNSRFQSAYGVEKMLRIIQQILIQNDFDTLNQMGLDENLRLITQVFHLEGHVVGRGALFKNLEEWNHEVSSSKSNQMLLLSGSPGIGKSSILSQFVNSRWSKRALILKGKCDQEAASRAGFGPVREIFRNLYDLVVSFGVKMLSQVEVALGEGLRGRENALLKICAEWSPFFKHPTSLPPLPTPDEEIARINQTLGDCLVCVMNVLLNADRLCIVIDDVQWLDESSTAFVEYLITSTTIQCNILCSCRPLPEHCVFSRLLAKENIQVCCRKFNITPLNPTDIQLLLSLSTNDGFGENEESLQKLSHTIFDKTNGNPFFVKEVLSFLVSDHLIFFDPDSGLWDYEMSAIQKLPYSSEVVSFLSKKVSHLSNDAREVLATAACLGNQFSLHLISKVFSSSPNFPTLLSQLMSCGLVEKKMVGQEEFVMFAHDNIQQLGFTFLSEEEKQKVHLKISNCMIEENDNGKQNLLQLVGHLCVGWHFIDNLEQKIFSFHKILEGVDMAMANTTYDVAYLWLVEAQKLYKQIEESLPFDSSPPNTTSHNSPTTHQSRRDIFFTMMSQFVLCAWRSQKYQIALEIIETQVLSRTDLSNSERIEFLRNKALIYTQLGCYSDAFGPVCEALQLLNHPIVLEYDMKEVDSEVIRVFELVEQKGGISSLLCLEECHISTYRLISDLFFDLVPISFVLKKFSLYCMLSVYSVLNSLQHGMMPASAEGFAVFGFVASSFLGHQLKGGEMCKLAERFVRSGKVPSNHISRSLVHSGLGGQWAVSHQTVSSWFERAISPGVMCGDIAHSTYACAFYFEYAMISGQQLHTILSRADEYLPLTRQAGQVDMEYFIHSIRSWAKWLVGKSESLPQFTETLAARPPFTTSAYFIFGALATFLNGDVRTALHLVQSGEDGHVIGALGMGRYFEFFFISIIVFAVSVKLDLISKNGVEEKIKTNLTLMSEWAVISPQNWKSRYLIANSIWEIVLSHKNSATHINSLELIRSLEIAIKETDCTWVRAAGLLCASHGAELLDLHVASRSYRLESVRTMKDWGSQRHQFAVSTFTKTKTNSYSTTCNSNIGMLALIKSAQLLATNETKESLFKEFFKILFSTSGASRMVLALCSGDDKKGDTLQVVGSWSSMGMLELEECPLEQKLPVSLASLVFISQQTKCLSDINVSQFSTDEYFKRNNVKSVLCYPIMHKGNKKGLVYLENDSMTDAFDEEKAASLKVVTTQMILSADNLEAFESLRKKNLDLLELDSLKDDIIARISHELRTPLNGIIGIASFGKSERRSCEEAEQDFEMITKCGEQLLMMVNDLLDFSRLRSKRLELKLQVCV